MDRSEMGEFLRMNPDLPLARAVYEILREQILRCGVKSGEYLREISVSEMIGVSRTPVREALKRLAAEGLVRQLPARGMLVTDIREQELLELCGIWEALETYSMRTALSGVHQKAHDEKGGSSENGEDFEAWRLLQEAEKQFETVCKTESTEKEAACAAADEAFHKRTVLLCRNQKLSRLFSENSELLYRYRLRFMKEDPDIKDHILQHRQILVFLHEKRASQAEKALMMHIDHMRKTLQKVLA